MKHHHLLLSVALTAVMSSLVLPCAAQPYKDPNLPIEERVEDLLGRLTLEEKVQLMQNNDANGIERLGIHPYDWWSEALHGVCGAGLATVFPNPTAMASTFDDEAVEKVFSIVSDEARAKFHERHRQGIWGGGRYGLTFWTPNVNIFRDPRWGRGQETYGEDPYLMSRMGVAVVKGLQGPDTAKYDKVHACAKHYAVHSGPEPLRHTFNVETIDPRDLWETYLPAFKATVQEGNVQEVMCAYQRFEGDPCCGSDKLLMQILRDEWGYQHLVVSDCGAIADFYQVGHHETEPDGQHASARGVLSGTDLECGDVYQWLPEAVRQGLVSEEQVDISLRRLLTARFALGEMDDDSIVPWSRISYDTVDCATHRQAALDMARKALVLLHNNGILPLSPEAHVAVLGPNADNANMQWGNYNGVPSHTVTVLDAMRSRFGSGIVFDRISDLVGESIISSDYDKITVEGRPGMKGSYWNNQDLSGAPVLSMRYGKRIGFNVGGETSVAPGVNPKYFSARYSGVFCPDESGDYTIDIAGDDGYRVRLNGKEVISDWRERSTTTAQYTFTAEAGKKYAIEVEYMQAAGEAILRFDIGRKHTVTAADAVKAAGDAEVVIYVGGISPSLEGEEMGVDLPGFKGGDRTTIELPAIQRSFIQALHDAGKKVIFVNCSGSAIALCPEVENCDAILQAWYPGQEGGTAIVEALYGDINPSGKLPITFYKNDSQLPDFMDYSMKGRTYRYLQDEPLFCFGHGLSYTTFSLSKIRANHRRIRAGKGLRLSLRLCNTGERDGAEVVQVYIRKQGDVNGPIKSLRAFRRVEVAKGKRTRVRIKLAPEAFEFFDEDTNTMRIVPGQYDIFVGTSSAVDTPALTVKVK